MEQKKKSVIGAALLIEFTVCVLQGLHHEWLISGMGITLMTLSFYLTLKMVQKYGVDPVEDDRREARQSMLGVYPSLQSLYSADDGNIVVLYCNCSVPSQIHSI